MSLQNDMVPSTTFLLLEREKIKDSIFNVLTLTVLDGLEIHVVIFLNFASTINNFLLINNFLPHQN